MGSKDYSRKTNRRTDGQTDRQTDRQTVSLSVQLLSMKRPCFHKLKHRNNNYINIFRRYIYIERERQRQRERERETETETDRDRDRDSVTETDEKITMNLPFVKQNAVLDRKNGIHGVS